jgi:hypothetical protein
MRRASDAAVPSSDDLQLTMPTPERAVRDGETVEMQLAHIYRKLDIARRRELARLLGSPE